MMLIYLLLLFIVCASYVPFRKYKSALLKIWFILIGLLFILRSGNVGTDTPQYYLAYQKIIFLGWNDANQTRYEPGYFLFNKIVALFSHNPQAIIIVSGCIIVFGTYLFIKRFSNYYLISTVLFMMFGVMANAMTATRQTLALIVFLFFLPNILRKRKILSFLGVVLASTFHISALILMIPLGIYLYFEKTIKWLWKFSLPISLLLIGSSSSIFFLATKILSKYQGYSESVFFSTGILGALMNYLISMTIVVIGGAIYFKYSREYNQLHMFILIMVLFDLFTASLGFNIGILYRLNGYFKFFQLIWIPLVISAIPKKEKYLRLLLSVSIQIVAILYFVTTSLYRPEWTGIVPYRYYGNDLNVVYTWIRGD